MSQTIDVNGQSINYPETGDTNWGDEATDFAVQTSAAFGKLGLASGTSVDIAQTLDVTGNTTLDANLSVAGTTSLTGNVTLTNNLTVNGNTSLGDANTDTTTITGIVNVDSGVLYVDPVNSRVGINDTTPSQALDVTGNVAITGNETVGGTLNVTGATSLSSTLAVTGNSTLTGDLSVNGNTTLGNASGDSLTINSNGVSIPNGLNFDSNTLVIDATNNRVGMGTTTPLAQLGILGAGQTTGNLSTSTNLGGTLYVRDSGALAGNGGAVLFGASQGSFAAIKGLITDGSNNTLGELSFSTRTANSDSALTEKLKLGASGQISAVVPGGSTLYPGFLCRAWVNFNGTGTVAIRASGNVSSITDNGTGDYTVNLTNAMPDANYSLYINALTSGQLYSGILGLTSYSASSFRFRTVRYNGTTLVDEADCFCGVFR